MQGKHHKYFFRLNKGGFCGIMGHLKQSVDTQNCIILEYFPEQHTEIHEMLKNKDLSEIPQEIKDKMLVLLFEKVFEY